MIVVSAFLAGLVVLAVLGRDLRLLADLQLRLGGVGFVAVAAQTALISLPPSVPQAVAGPLHSATYGALLGVLLVNRHLRHVGVLAVGVACNALAIVANGGVMPASPTAVAAAGFDVDAGFANSAAVAGARLQPLGDVLVTPAWLPLRNVVSVGDVAIVLGALAVVWGATARRRPAAAAAPAPLEA